jgi:peptidyl-prolyl cis-trans isomerase SurA
LTSFSIAQEFKIILKINNSIITNTDIDNEYNYLIALNKDLNKIKKEEILDIAKDSLVREKIKKDEIEKYINFEEYDNNNLINEVIKNVYKRLNFQSISDFANYLNTFGLSLNEVKNKLKIEIMWNQLIAEKFKNKILIDEDKIRKKIQKEKINYKNLIQYDLSEIVFTAKNTQELISKKEKIKSIIDDIGFETAANKFSISETANFGGNIGKVNENQLSLIIKDQLKDIGVGEHTSPINVGNNFMIIKINEKKVIDLKIDEDEMVNKIIEVEKKKQYENFSFIFYNKIKLNTQIDEL